MKYKLIDTIVGAGSHVFTSDGSMIPLADEQNVDTQEYLKWLEAGNTPDPADDEHPHEWMRLVDTPTPKKGQRARNPDGSFKGDNPTTPNINEAYNS